jgi:protein CpxP
MTDRFRRITLGAGAAVIAVGMAAGLYASTQNTLGEPGSFIGRRPPFARMGGPLGPMRMLASKLGITDDQKQQIKTVMQSHRDEWKALADRAATAHKALHDAVTAETIDENAIRQHSAEVAAVQADMAVARAHAHAEIFKLLTPEQQNKARELRAKAEERLGHLRERLQQRGF